MVFGTMLTGSVVFPDTGSAGILPTGGCMLDEVGQANGDAHGALKERDYTGIADIAEARVAR